VQIKVSKRSDQKASALAMEILATSKGFSAEETDSPTDQIRRSSRSVCMNFREAWAKRRSGAHFVN
jgi:four helix bundle protein